MRPPPSSTLFPYTTLFRSDLTGRAYAQALKFGARVMVAKGATRLACDGQDRKSTRLNSSHGYISYAVFCLKKKTCSSLPFFTRTHTLCLVTLTPLCPTFAS